MEIGVSAKLAEKFVIREDKVIEMIKASGIQFDEVGVFGSYARGDFTGSSDIDFCIITDNRPSRAVSGRLREEIELLGAEVIFVSKEYFLGDASAFANNLRRDYRRVL